MKMTIRQLIEAQGAIQMLRQSRNVLAAQISLRLARFWRHVQPEYEAYQVEEIRLFREKGIEEGGRYVLPLEPAARKEFLAELEAMQAEEIELRIKPFDYDDIKPAGPSADDILALAACGLLLIDWDTLGEDGELDAPEPEEK
ncbi:MAG: hypothetical protein KDK05_13275 [Candidatus Competibacteraceae bacterium]|nr:hypothetical protein [Candidatus Competibacteraceae bacterium]